MNSVMYLYVITLYNMTKIYLRNNYEFKFIKNGKREFLKTLYKYFKIPNSTCFIFSIQ